MVDTSKTDVVERLLVDVPSHEELREHLNEVKSRIVYNISQVVFLSKIKEGEDEYIRSDFYWIKPSAQELFLFPVSRNGIQYHWKFRNKGQTPNLIAETILDKRHEAYKMFELLRSTPIIFAESEEMLNKTVKDLNDDGGFDVFYKLFVNKERKVATDFFDNAEQIGIVDSLLELSEEAFNDVRRL